MRQIELRKRAGQMGYRLESSRIGDAKFTSITRLSGTVAVIDESRINTVDTTFQKKVPTELFDAIVAYARTPVEKRDSQEMEEWENDSYCI